MAFYFYFCVCRQTLPLMAINMLRFSTLVNGTELDLVDTYYCVKKKKTNPSTFQNHWEKHNNYTPYIFNLTIIGIQISN